MNSTAYKLLLNLCFAVIACVLAALYVWSDRPDASDAGQHTLSGWLVDTFGAHSARLAGVSLFSGLAFLLFAIVAFSIYRLRNPR